MTDQSPPLLRIVRGDATPEEVAALVAVLQAKAAGSPAAPAPATSEWSAHHRKVRTAFPSGPGGWRSSSLPR